MTKKMKENQFYCVSCRKRVMQKDSDAICVTTLDNPNRPKGVPALFTGCPNCDINLYKFISDDAKVKMTRKYGKC